MWLRVVFPLKWYMQSHPSLISTLELRWNVLIFGLRLGKNYLCLSLNDRSSKTTTQYVRELLFVKHRRYRCRPGQFEIFQLQYSERSTRGSRISLAIDISSYSLTGQIYILHLNKQCKISRFSLKKDHLLQGTWLCMFNIIHE